MGVRPSGLVSRGGRASGKAAVARRVVARLGGRFSTELGIDVDGGDAQVERWFVAATLFGTRISAAIAERTFRVLDAAGLRRIAAAKEFSWEQLIELLGRGGYARYDNRTANRLHALAAAIGERYGGEVGAIGRAHPTYEALRAALDALPGWGPVTVSVFLRELRGVWPGATPPLDERAARAATHLGVLAPTARDPLKEITSLARAAGLDVRDLECGLVRLALAHRRITDCPGGAGCVVLAGT